MYSYTACTNYSDLNDLLYQLWWYNLEGISPQGENEYKMMYHKFIGELTGDVDVAISFFKTLDMDKSVDSYAMSFVGSIVKNLKTDDEKTKFQTFISTLSEEYPNSPYVDWSAYTINSMDDVNLNSSSSSENTVGEDSSESTVDENPEN